jgi:hypothetical protein
MEGKPGKLSAKIQSTGDTTKNDLNLSINNSSVNLSWSNKTDSSKINSLSGVISDKIWTGSGYDVNGNVVNWNMIVSGPYVEKPDTSKPKQKKNDINTTVLYPFVGYGFSEMPKQEDVLIKNATVWTNEADTILQNTDVLIKNGKIAAVGKNLSASNTKQIDGTNEYLTPGIIDEHSHIAVDGGVNECSQSVTSEVRIADVIDPEDIQIYRQLSDGVTAVHILHGSCNTIGGQTQMIKMRWGKDAERFLPTAAIFPFSINTNLLTSLMLLLFFKYCITCSQVMFVPI